MQGLIGLKERFDVAFACDPDHDRHGIVTPSGGLLAPNNYLAVSIDYLFQNRPQWRADAAIGKTVVSSGLIDRVAARLGRRLYEVPVGFKWFADGLFDGSLGFGGEESAGASFLRKDGSVWSTDKDGLIPGLLAAEMTSRTGPGNEQAIGGLKVMTANGWFAARPSGTEDIYKIYAESFIGADHLQRLVEEAQVLVDGAISPA